MFGIESKGWALTSCREKHGVSGLGDGNRTWRKTEPVLLLHTVLAFVVGRKFITSCACTVRCTAVIVMVKYSVTTSQVCSIDRRRRISEG